MASKKDSSIPAASKKGLSDQARADQNTHFSIQPQHPTLWQKPTAKNVFEILERALATVNRGFTIADATKTDYPLIYVNETFCALTGYSPNEVLGRNCRFLQGPETRDDHVAVIRAAITAGQGCTVVLRNYRKDGTPFWNEMSLSPLRDAAGTLTHFVGMQHDVTARVQAEQELLNAKANLERTTLALATTTLELEQANAKYYHDAFHDILTGLANRALLTDRLEHTLERDKRQPAQFAVLFLDLDGFKPVNDSLGHAIGDKLLISVADRLKTCVRPTDTVARLGGDEFAVLLEDLSQAEEASMVAERIQMCLAERFILEGHTIYVSASLGIVLGGRRPKPPVPYNQAGDVLRDADTAMYQAKKSGKSQSVIFMPDMRSVTGTLETDLRKALNNGELNVYYQPILSAPGLELVGFEALLRWHHPQRGEIFPNVFMPLAEETGLVVTLDRYVLRESSKQLRAWQLQQAKPLTLNVNVSGFQLFRQDLIPYLNTVLAETGLNANHLRLELTESVMINLGQAVQKRLQDLQNLGVKLYIDDAGKNVSSLGYLKDLPSTVLKIDRSFTQRVDKGIEGEELVRGIVVMAHSLGLGVVADGIENERQLELVQTLKCEFVQGDFFSPPLAPHDVGRFVFEAEGFGLTAKQKIKT